MRPKLLFLITEDWFFISHRLSIAKAAQDAGFDVVIATRVNEHGDIIRREGFKLIPIGLKRGSVNPIQEICSLWEVIRVYMKERPQIVHHVAMKPILYGSLAACLTNVPGIVNALAGMGYMFTSSDRLAVILKILIKPVLSLFLNTKGSVLILQNADDLKLLVENGIARKEKVIMIRGSGVNTEHFSYKPEAEGPPVIMLASRMLRDKGINEFIDAAKELKERGINARFILVGSTDTDNPSSIPIALLKQWHDSGIIEWWGHQKNMHEVFAKTHIVVLPSYREGLPKVLLEAAACGRPIVATDVPGCREIVRNGENGILVPAMDSHALAVAMERLIVDSNLRKKLGGQGRQIVLDNFSEEKVTAQTIAVYHQCIKNSSML